MKLTDIVIGALQITKLFFRFVPEQKKWCCYNKFFQNRHFIALRGNEVIIIIIISFDVYTSLFTRGGSRMVANLYRRVL